MNAGRRLNEFPLWANLITLFPLLAWRTAYDSFHEPKWHFLSIVVGVLLLLRLSQRQRIFSPITPLDLPIWFCLIVTLVAWRWDAADRWVSFMLWFRLFLAYLLFRLWVSAKSDESFSPRNGIGFDLAVTSILAVGVLAKEWVLVSQVWGPTLVWSLIVVLSLGARFLIQHFVQARETRPNEAFQSLLDCFLAAGVGVAFLAILQDWGIARWSGAPVSDWRFHLSSTLGNPNEVGGYLSYLIPAVLYRVWTAKLPGVRVLWAVVGLVFVYALTTVFTVGAWLGLFVILPVSLLFFWRSAQGSEFLFKSRWFLLVLPAALFLLLQGSMRVPLEGGVRTFVVLGFGGILAGIAWLVFRRTPCGGLGTLMLVGLLAVWSILLIPWGIPNHRQGLIEEAVSSPRWQGGFGARRFIWKTTGLMVKDHPIRGVGYGHYYFLHAAYQGEIYAATDKPHDRPTVGQVPQVHSDPLQVLAESGPLGSIGFLWLGFAAFGLGLTPISRSLTPESRGFVWVLWTGLGLIAFHSAVDFPLRQPQPALLAVFFVSALAAHSVAGVRTDRAKQRIDLLAVPFALMFLILGTLGFRDQVALKTGYEGFLSSRAILQADLREDRLRKAAGVLEGIRYPLPETQDRWLYLARVYDALGEPEAARSALFEARNYRHSLALYQTWKDHGQLNRDPRVVLDSIRGMIRYNPNWAGFHQEAADLWRLIGDEGRAGEEQALAEKFRVRSR